MVLADAFYSVHTCVQGLPCMLPSLLGMVGFWSCLFMLKATRLHCRDVKEETRGLAAEGRQASASRGRRRKGKTFTLRNAVTLLVLLGFLAMLSIMYSRLWPRLPA